MGCTNSKRTRCQCCNRPYSPPNSRSYSLPLIYRSHWKSDAYHVITPDQSFSNQDSESHRSSRCSVSMAKVKNESLSLMDSTMRKGMFNVNEREHKKIHDEDDVIGHANEFSSVPRTPNRNPYREPETINAWELMEGLEDNRNLSKSSPQGVPVFSDRPKGKRLHFLLLTDYRLRKLEKEGRQWGRSNKDIAMILKGLGIRVDERDVSMHYRFREELKELLGSGFIDGLPKVFAKGRYIGGAYEIKQMNEEGELQKLLQGCEKENDDEMYEVCVDVRFVPCDKCSGSCKIYYEDENGEGRGNK
ncbi:hypothetical protein Syun_021030 [Stephania yunnanensis]|uniref:Glutaredoxin domain-containing protein n=1 Tax=Stephania yunnanensis TaxID=152371 RepID=A0AAP0NPF0_9MAGN